MSAALDPQHYKAILEGLPNGLYVVDVDRKILFWNRGAELITGYRSRDVVGRHCQDNLLMHCDENYTELCGCRCPLQQTILDGRSREVDVYLRHKDGQRVPVKIRAVAVRNSEGTIIGASESFDERHGVSALQIHPNAQAVNNHLEDLTGVSDRESTQSYLEACLRDYEEDRAPFSVLTLEVDDLENFRKERGAQAVAKLLHIIAVTLSKNLREGDIIGHWSGGRFVGILVNCPAATLAPMVFMLKRLISVAEISWWGDRISTTVSIGGAVVRPGDTVDALLARSEQALLACSAKGGDGGDVL